MIDSSRVLAIIPARAGSKGLPGKNIRPLRGKPLLAWPIHTANKSKYIDRVVVSTENEEIAKIARIHGAEIPTLRPPEFASDNSPSSDAIIHMIDFLDNQGDNYEYLILLEPTSPLTEPEDVDLALEYLHNNRNYGDFIVSVDEAVKSHPAFAFNLSEHHRLKPYGEADFSMLPRRQELEPLFFLDGSFYISAIDKYKKTLSFVNERTFAHPLPAYKSLEIDTLLDFYLVETVLSNFKDLKSNSES